MTTVIEYDEQYYNSLENYKVVVVTEDYSSVSGRWFAKKGAKGKVVSSNSGNSMVLFDKNSQGMFCSNESSGRCLDIPNIYLLSA